MSQILARNKPVLLTVRAASQARQPARQQTGQPFDGTNPLNPGDPGAVPSLAIHYGNLVDLGDTESV